MADLSDVENAIVSGLLAALYPNGISQVSTLGVACRVYRGWPSPAALNTDLAAGTVNVTIFASTIPDEVPDPYFDKLYALTHPASLIATVTEQSVTISGVVAPNQIVGLLVDGAPFSYAVNAGDTTESIAANFTALISAGRISGVSGSTITIPGAKTLIARVVTNTTVLQSLRRQRREIQASCWCPSPLIRDSISAIVDRALAISPFIDLADGTKAHARYVSTQVYDQSQNALLYRRDLRYRFEYTTISNLTAPVMLFGDLVNNGSGVLV
jgi:hypothetical protein